MRILLGTDGSAHATMARDLLAAIAWPAGSRIRVVTTVAPFDVTYGGPFTAGAVAGMDALESDVMAHAHSIVAEAMRGIVAEGWSVEGDVLRGRPGTCLVEDARSFGADVIVMGSRGHGPIMSMLLGSVAAEVVDHAPCPVLVARHPRLTRVVLGHDGSDCARVAEDLLTDWPIFADVAVEVVSVAQQAGSRQLPSSAALYPSTTPDYFEGYRALLDEHRQVAAAAAQRLSVAGLRVTDSVVEGDPAQALLRVADERQADLILVGSHGRTGLERLLLGSVARNVMQHAPVSVLVARSRSTT